MCSRTHLLIHRMNTLVHKNWHMMRSLRYTRWALTHTETHKHTHAEWCQPEFLLCCSSVWDSCWGCYWTQSVTQRKRESETDGECNAKKNRVYMESEGTSAHSNTFICVSTSKDVFTAIGERARQRGELNVILTHRNLMYYTVHNPMLSISYFIYIIEDDMRT